MTVEVFDSLASSQGLQKSGWFAKIVKDKFNIKLNIIAPNVSGAIPCSILAPLPATLAIW